MEVGISAIYLIKEDINGNGSPYTVSKFPDLMQAKSKNEN